MGLTPFACITLPDSVRIVYPDGHVDSLSRGCSVYELLLGNPDYYVCGSFPHSLANRMAADDVLQKGLTYFVCATPNAQPFLSKKSATRPSRMMLLPRLSRRGMREMRSPTHQSKVFDVQSATTMQQQLESLRGERPPKHLQQLKIVFVRHCLQALRLPRMDQLTDEPAPFANEVVVPAAPVADVLPVFKSAARSELGLYVSRRQEFYLRRARRRRKVVWKPVLQSISEMAPVVEFHMPVTQEENDSASARLSPSAPPRKNISPPRQPVVAAAPPKNISPPRQQPSFAKQSSAPPQQQQQQQQQQQEQQQQQQQHHYHHQQQRSRGNNRSLYMA